MLSKKNQIQISVIIPTYNRKKELSECIKSLTKQKNCSFEIIVIDDCSADSTKKTKDMNVYYKMPKRVGPNACRNEGAKRAKGDILVFCDSDSIFTKKTILTQITTYLQLPHIGSIGGYFESDAKAYANTTHGKKSFDELSLESTSVFIGATCDWISSNNLAVKKKIFNSIGGFDSNIIGSSTEVEFGLTLKSLKLQNYLIPSICVYHSESNAERYNIGLTYQNQSLRKKELERMKWKQRNRVSFVFRHLFQEKWFNINSQIISYDFIIRPITEIISILSHVKQTIQSILLRRSFRTDSTSLVTKIQFFSQHIFTLIDSIAWNVFIRKNVR